MQASEVKPKLAAQGFPPVGMCGADFGALLRKEYDHYGGIIRADQHEGGMNPARVAPAALAW